MYEFTSKIRYTECNPDLKLKITSMIDLMQNCSAAHSEAVGHYIKDQLKIHEGWFILSWQIKIKRMPEFMEDVTVRTWSAEIRGIIANREYDILDANGDQIICAHTIWTLMDLEKIKPKVISDQLKEAYGAEGYLPGQWSNRKLRPVSDDWQTIYEFIVSERDIDTNGHMNNEKYISAALPAVETMMADAGMDERKITAAAATVHEDATNFQPSYIAVEYRNQAIVGDQIEVKAVHVDDTIDVMLSHNDKIFSIVRFQ